MERNGDFVGWLTIEESKIDYPVMKAAEEDPEFYLHRDFDGKDSSSGCLFIGAGCDADLESFVIYGHKMNNDSMFGTLDSYSEDAFAQEHSEIKFSTPEGELVYRVFASFQTKIYKDRSGFEITTSVYFGKLPLLSDCGRAGENSGDYFYVQYCPRHSC